MGKSYIRSPEQFQDSECNDVAQALAQQDQDKLELLLQRSLGCVG